MTNNTNTNKLSGARVYLSGPIEYASDLGKGWREEFTKRSKELGLDLVIINPCNKPLHLAPEVSGEYSTTTELRKNKDWAGLRKAVKIFRRQDLRFTDISDALVIYVDRNIHMCGSYDEAYTAERQRKPIFCIVKGGIAELPTWLFGVFKLEHIFPTVEACIQYLYELSHREIELDDNWVLINI